MSLELRRNEVPYPFSCVLHPSLIDTLNPFVGVTLNERVDVLPPLLSIDGPSSNPNIDF